MLSHGSVARVYCRARVNTSLNHFEPLRPWPNQTRCSGCEAKQSQKGIPVLPPAASWRSFMRMANWRPVWPTQALGHSEQGMLYTTFHSLCVGRGPLTCTNALGWRGCKVVDVWPLVLMLRGLRGGFPLLVFSGVGSCHKVCLTHTAQALESGEISRLIWASWAVSCWGTPLVVFNLIGDFQWKHTDQLGPLWELPYTP